MGGKGAHEGGHGERWGSEGVHQPPLTPLSGPGQPDVSLSPPVPSAMARRKADVKGVEWGGKKETEQREGKEEKKEAFDRAVWKDRA